jgi:hypothetical protein
MWHCCRTTSWDVTLLSDNQLGCDTAVGQLGCDIAVRQTTGMWHCCRTTSRDVTLLSDNQLGCDTAVGQSTGMWHCCRTINWDVTLLSDNQLRCDTAVKQLGCDTAVGLGGMWHCCRTTYAHWLEGTKILSNMRNYFPNDTVPHPTVWPFSNTLCLMQYQNESADHNKIIVLWRILVIHVLYSKRQKHSSTRLVIQQLCTTYWHYLA